MNGVKLIEALRRAEIPCSAIYSIVDIFADPQYAARGSLASFVHPRARRDQMPCVVPRLSQTPGAIEWLCRDLGEDTDEALSRALGYSPARIAELRRQGIV